MLIKEMSYDERQERRFNECIHTGKNSVFEGLIGTMRLVRLGGCIASKVCDLVRTWADQSLYQAWFYEATEKLPSLQGLFIPLLRRGSLGSHREAIAPH